MRSAVPVPAVALALALNGFFLYLAVLDLAGSRPRTWLTGTYYAALGALLLALAWRRRGILVQRLQAPTRATWAFALLAGLLSGWYLLNVALLSEGPLATRFAILLVTWSLPSALLAASLTRSELDGTVRALVGLGVVFVAFETIAIFRNTEDVNRFSPIQELDPISAGLIPALSAIAALALGMASRRGRLLQLFLFTLLVAATVLPGSRSPVLSLLVAVGAITVLSWRRLWLVVAPGLAVGLLCGWLVSTSVGSASYYTYGVPGFANQQIEEPFSTLSIRRQLWAKALHAVPDKPVFGHGVGMLVDDTREAYRLGIAGRRVSPHNAFIESLYSLGVVGAVLYVSLLAVTIWALLRLVARLADSRFALFALGLFAFAFVNSNISGQIGADAARWAAGALAVALYADAVRLGDAASIGGEP